MPDDLIVERVGHAGRLTLNRPAALNALTHAMCRTMAAQLGDWARDDAVKLVLIDGAGDKAFCAGGDIRALYAAWRDGRLEERTTFYRDEYRLNALIKRYPKPYVALIDGIVMGGGVGVSIHGSHRVATERTVFAMPETGIGLFPDVGGTYFLPRLPGEIGTFLGLTGHRMRAADCRYAGLAEATVAADRLPALVDALADACDRAAIDDVLRRFDGAAADPAPIAGLREDIDSTFAHDRVEAILDALERSGTVFAGRTLEALRQKSPTSLKVTLRQLRAGRALSFESCMRLEYRLACRFMNSHDFFEGVRAVVIDKDGRPAWRPATLEAVTDEMIAEYFAPLPEGDLALA